MTAAGPNPNKHNKKCVAAVCGECLAINYCEVEMCLQSCVIVGGCGLMSGFAKIQVRSHICKIRSQLDSRQEAT